VGGASGHDTLKISRLLADQRVRERFIFMGYVPDGEVAQLYASCDVFCFPSLWEGFGIPLAEAQAVGKPVVAFNNCAVPEVVEDQRTGILVPPRNWRKLAKSVVFLLKNRDVAYVMGKAGRERVGRLFTWDRVAKVVETAYEKAVEYHGVRC
jgi:glycosyltransferase involved in cell wall biosynthesis